MAIDLQEIHAQEFTDIERQTLRLWFDVDKAGNDVLADAILNAGLQFEHYTSLLPDEPEKRTLQQLAKQSRLAFLLSEQVAIGQAFLASQKASGAVQAAAFASSLEAFKATAQQVIVAANDAHQALMDAHNANLPAE